MLKSDNTLVIPGALGKRLGGGDDLISLGGSNNDLNLLKLATTRMEQGRIAYLDRPVVDEEAIQLLEGLASTVRLVEGHVCDTTALRVGAVGELNSLDRTNGLDEVFLSGENSVSLPKCIVEQKSSFRLRASVVPVPGECYIARFWEPNC
jgi:hypothetical protein